MINSLLSCLFWLLARLCDIILYPITLLITNFFPDITQFIYDCEWFFDYYVFDVIKFVKSAFMNITGFPQIIWDFIWIWIASTYIIRGSIPVYRAIISIINKFKES